MRLVTIQQQKGFGLSGLLVTSFFLILLAVFGMKLVPVYLEYFSIKKSLTATAKEAPLPETDINQIKMVFSKKHKSTISNQLLRKILKLIKKMVRLC